MPERWRVGRRNPHNVYRQHGPEPRGMDEPDPDDSLGYFRLSGDAATAVRGVEALAVLAELVALCDDEDAPDWSPTWARARGLVYDVAEGGADRG